MSNVDQIAIMMDLLKEMETMMGTMQNRIDTFEERGDDITRSFLTAQQFERVMYRLTSIMKRMGLGSQIGEALTSLSRLIMVARMATMTIHFLEMSTPYGWLMGGLGAVSTTFMAGEALSEMGTQYAGTPGPTFGKQITYGTRGT